MRQIALQMLLVTVREYDANEAEYDKKKFLTHVNFLKPGFKANYCSC